MMLSFDLVELLQLVLMIGVAISYCFILVMQSVSFENLNNREFYNYSFE